MDGKKIAMGIGVWMVIKGVLNLLMGFGLGNIISLVIAVVLAVLVMAGVPYCNYVVAVILGIGVLKNLPYNLMNFQIIYLLEAVVDVVCLLMLVIQRDVKAHFERA